MYEINSNPVKKMYTQFIQNKELIGLLILCTIVFMLLYHKILWGGYIYAYKDIGSDTLYSYLPNYIFDSEWIGSGKFSGYTLQYGLGTYIENSLFKYLIPFNFIFLFCNSENIGILLVISLYVKIITAAVFSYRYFVLLVDNKKVALVGGLTWSFCSYIVVWGQHYQFGTRIALFTIGIYFLEQYFKKKEKRIVLIIVLTLMWFDSYYAIYMNGIFYAMYLIVRGVQNKYSIRKNIRYLIELLGMALIAAALAMVKLLPEIISLFSSTRMSDVLAQGNTLPWHYSKEYLLSFIARFLSANTIGIGNDFSGAYNYYEVALLSTSLLSVFSFVFLAFTKYRKYIIVMGAMVFIALGVPAISQILNMNYLKQRWSFLLCFVFVISIVLFLAYIQKNREHIRCGLLMKYCVVISDICYICICMILLIAHKLGWVTINRTVLLSVIVVIVCYNLLLLWYAKSWNEHMWYALLFLLLIELLLMNYPSINNRDMVSVDDWNTDLYNDGTIEIIEQLKNDDRSIYRVNKSYISVSGYNEALIQGYNGVCVYSSLNTKELVDFYTFWGYDLLGGHPHYIFIPDEDYIINTILGVKYLITDKTEDVSEQYSKLFEDNNFIVYENKYTLPFAYLYDIEFRKSDIESLEGKDRQKALLYGFFVTSGVETGVIEKSSEDINIIYEKDDSTQLNKLKDNSATHFFYTMDGFRGNIYNKNEQDAMLVIPIIYNDNWSIYVDGVEQKLYNINSGLLGTIIPSGEHTISLIYKSSLTSIALGVSLVSFVIFVIVCVYNVRIKRNYYVEQ